MDNMTGKEIVKLIQRLKKEGMEDSKILDIIQDVESSNPPEEYKPQQQK